MEKSRNLDEPGTPEYRLNWLAQYTEREFDHSPFSSTPFEVSLISGITEIRNHNTRLGRIADELSSEVFKIRSEHLTLKRNIQDILEDFCEMACQRIDPEDEHCGACVDLKSLVQY